MVLALKLKQTPRYKTGLKKSSGSRACARGIVPRVFFGRGGVRHHGVGASAARQYFTSSSGT